MAFDPTFRRRVNLSPRDTVLEGAMSPDARSGPGPRSLAELRDAMSVRIDGEMSGEVPGRSNRARRILRGPRPEAVPGLVGRAVALVGLLDIAAGVIPRFRHSRMHALAEALPGSFGPFAAALSLSVGVLLLLLAHGLRRRKRRAWRAAVALLPAGAVAQFGYRHSLAGVLLAIVLLVPLVWHRREFAALPDPRSRWRALANFVLMSAGSLLLGLVIVSVTVNVRKMAIESGPEVLSRGFFYDSQTEKVTDGVRKLATAAIQQILETGKWKKGEASTLVVDKVTEYLRRAVNSTPIVTPVIMEVR